MATATDTEVGQLAKTLRGDLIEPDDPAFDMAVNVMQFDPGAALPFVETHANEHGLYMLAGGGIYRL
jgi:(S)-ureidoglycine aminohydrolase